MKTNITKLYEKLKAMQDKDGLLDIRVTGTFHGVSEEDVAGSILKMLNSKAVVDNKLF